MSENFVEAIIDRFEGELAILKINGQSEISWPRQNLPEGAKEGSVIYLFATLTHNDEERERLAKSLLNTILKDAK